MPWYKAGTVKTLAGKNAIIGTETAFIGNSRVGDAFRGPDGAWYEVTNISSDTAMSIAPVYQGPAVAAGSYALAPMQGYVKTSADALNFLVQKFRVVLANLGPLASATVANVSNGGTGATTAAAAATALGLGVAQHAKFAGVLTGAIELSSTTPLIDFHYNSTDADYNVRLINDADRILSLVGNYKVLGDYTSTGSVAVAGDMSCAVCNAVGYQTRTGVAGSFGGNLFNYMWSGVLTAYVDVTSVGNVTLTTSDYRIKRDVQEIKGVNFLDRIDAYRPVTYRRREFEIWYAPDENITQGLIAHEAQIANPLSATRVKDGLDENGNTAIQQIDPMVIITDLIGAVKELRAEIISLKSGAIGNSSMVLVSPE